MRVTAAMEAPPAARTGARPNRVCRGGGGREEEALTQQTLEHLFPLFKTMAVERMGKRAGITVSHKLRAPALSPHGDPFDDLADCDNKSGESPTTPVLTRPAT